MVWASRSLSYFKAWVFDDLIDYRRISEFELGEAEPPLPVLLQYAHIAGVHMEDIVDDELNLPNDSQAR